VNTVKLLIDASSSCCLILPLLNAAAAAAKEPALSTDVLTGAVLPYPTVGFYPSTADQSTLNQPSEAVFSVEAALNATHQKDGAWPLNIETVNLQTPDAPYLEEPVQLSIPFELADMAITQDNQTQDNQTQDELQTVQRLDHSVAHETSTQNSMQSSFNTEAVELGDTSYEPFLTLSETDTLDSTMFGTLYVELSSTESSARVATLVKGAENGHQAIAFEQWLIPFDDVIKALGFTASLEADGHLTLRSPEIVTQIQLESLPTDPDLGVMWSIADIAQHLGAVAEFNLATYTIQFNQAALNQTSSPNQVLGQAEPHVLAQDISPRDLALEKSGEIVSPLNTLQQSFDMIASLSKETFPPSPLLTNSIANSQTAVETSADPSIKTPLLPNAGSVAESVAAPELGVLLVGLAVGDITTVEATLVKGREDGMGAIAFDQWLIPFEETIIALGGSVSPTQDGLLTVRAPGLATIVDPQELQYDPDLGQVISIAKIVKDFGVAAEFDLSQYAIKFIPPFTEPAYTPTGLIRPSRQDYFSQPVMTDGLPRAEPSDFTLSAVSQSTRINSSQNNLLGTPTGQLSAVGSILDGSWYARLDQLSLSDYGTWQLDELQYLRQDNESDYVLGSQQTFWKTQDFDTNYWGATTIRRWGFSPPDSSSLGGFSPRTRLQSGQVGRTVSGEAAPGTFVQLTQGLNGPVVADVIVDSSGIYRFEDVPASSQLSGQYSDRSYLVQLYANGQLASQPEIRSAAFTTLPGQLSKGASALIASGGFGHQDEPGQLLGNFNTFRGGVAYRRGVSEELTLGAGIIQDGSPQILTEGFYLPQNVPLKAAFSATVGADNGEMQIDANVTYLPTKDLQLTFDSDRFSQRLRANWRPTPGLTLNATGDTRDLTMSFGARAAYQFNQWSGSAAATIDTRQNMNWSLYANNGPFSASHQGNEISTFSNMTYRLPFGRDRNSSFRGRTDGQAHELSLTHETFNSTAQSLTLSTGDTLSVGRGAGSLTTAEWRYRSPQRTEDGYSRWNASVGYSVGSRGSGPVAFASAALGGGIDLEMRYRSVSTFDDTDSLQISMVSRLGTQNGFGWGHRRQNELRTQGGLLLQPFFDTNADGVRDSDEPLYLDSPELLVTLNQSPISPQESNVDARGLSVPLQPNTYRLDIDPAGLPLDSTAAEMSYAVDVVPGQYTVVAVPLITTYSVSGVVIDENGLAVSGAQVEAVGIDGHRRVSVTNGAGVYYLERLKPETYELVVNGVSIKDNPLVLEGELEPFQEREITLL